MRRGSGTPNDTFGATRATRSADWRDPFVFCDAEAGLWRMLRRRPPHGRAPAPPRRHRAVHFAGPRHMEAGGAVLGPAPLHRARVPRSVRVERLVVPRLLRVLARRSPPATGWPAASTAHGSCRARHARRSRLLRRQVGERTGAASSSAGSPAAREHATTAPGSGPARCPCWRRAATLTAHSRSDSTAELRVHRRSAHRPEAGPMIAGHSICTRPTGTPMRSSRCDGPHAFRLRRHASTSRRTPPSAVSCCARARTATQAISSGSSRSGAAGVRPLAASRRARPVGDLR